MTDFDSQAQDQDRRKSLRIPMGISILIPHLQKKLLCHELSQEGCFFRESDMGPVGQTFSIIIDLPEMGLIPVEARMTHKGEDGTGSGLHFTVIEPAEAAKLAYFLDIFLDR